MAGDHVTEGAVHTLYFTVNGVPCSAWAWNELEATEAVPSKAAIPDEIRRAVQMVVQKAVEFGYAYAQHGQPESGICGKAMEQAEEVLCQEIEGTLRTTAHVPAGERDYCGVGRVEAT